MRDIYETAKKAQMAPVRGRVKAMMAQPRAVAQARKTARQTTGFKKGGTLIVEEIQSDVFPKVTTTTTKKKGKQAGGKISTPMTHDSDFTRWFESQYGGTEKGKPHSTLEGRAAAGRRYMRRAEKYWTKKREEEKKRKDDPHHPRDKRRAGPQAPAQPSPKAGPPAGRPKEYQDPFKKQKEEEGMYVKKGGVMEKGKPHSTKIGKVSSMYRRVLRSRDKDRLSGRDIERASGKEYATASEIHALHEMLKKETPRGKENGTRSTCST